jgi:hypothetical protein
VGDHNLMQQGRILGYAKHITPYINFASDTTTYVPHM